MRQGVRQAKVLGLGQFFKTYLHIKIVFVWSDKLGANQNNRTKAMFGTRNKDYVGGATC